MKHDLWLLYWQEYDDFEPIAVYSSQEAAEKAVDEVAEPFTGDYRIESVENRL